MAALHKLPSDVGSGPSPGLPTPWTLPGTLRAWSLAPAKDPRPELTSLGYHLWATQIQVDGITVILSQESRLDKHLWVIGTELKKTQELPQTQPGPGPGPTLPGPARGSYVTQWGWVPGVDCRAASCPKSL